MLPGTAAVQETKIPNEPHNISADSSPELSHDYYERCRPGLISVINQYDSLDDEKLAELKDMRLELEARALEDNLHYCMSIAVLNALFLDLKDSIPSTLHDCEPLNGHLDLMYYLGMVFSDKDIALNGYPFDFKLLAAKQLALKTAVAEGLDHLLAQLEHTATTLDSNLVGLIDTLPAFYRQYVIMLFLMTNVKFFGKKF